MFTKACTVINISKVMRRASAPSKGEIREGRLLLPFKPPKLACSKSATWISDRPVRKRQRVCYAEDENATISRSKGDDSDFDDGEERIPLGDIPINKYASMSFARKNPKSTLARRFSLPVINKDAIPFSSSPRSLGVRPKAKLVARPLYDPMADHAIVLYDPTIDMTEEESAEIARVKEEAEKLKAAKRGASRSLAEILGIDKEQRLPNVPVVIDPRLGKVLRPHQVEGVKFLYKCTTGQIVKNAYGCIMADEMGLGKTLQCIALMWTLLRQSPTPFKPTIEKCVIACPSSLVRNWANELDKWLGKDTVTPLAIDGKGTKEQMLQAVRQFASAQGRSVTKPVLIVSYETLRTNVVELAKCQIGLLLCDEGHRLKNSDSLTFQALDSLQVQRRVILSGTPIQNDLSEYFSLLNFANPGLLGTRGEFRKNYELAILRGRDADATEQDRIKSDEKLLELSTLVSRFIIRRTNDLLSKYLPVKYEHVVFCKLSPFQLDLYNYFITSPDIKRILRGVGSQPLKAITLLKKLCNHPDLLDLELELEGSSSLFPDGYSVKEKKRMSRPEFSGKMRVLARMLRELRDTTKDKIVLISNYTQTLDIFEKYCRSQRYGCLRLDGTMNVSKRQKLVDRFNDPEGDEFVFLLSSKAGGCGINLIGANRLILFDPDWNPAADQQALARVWRDGQKKDCFVYRFIATGTIEEKIFQRQSHKQSLSSCVVDEASDVERHFSLESLRQLFEFNRETICDTHDTFRCKRCKDGKQSVKASAILYGDTSTWNHYRGDMLETIHDVLLQRESEKEDVSYVFQYISH